MKAENKITFSFCVCSTPKKLPVVFALRSVEKLVHQNFENYFLFCLSSSVSHTHLLGQRKPFRAGIQMEYYAKFYTRITNCTLHFAPRMLRPWWSSYSGQSNNFYTHISDSLYILTRIFLFTLLVLKSKEQTKFLWNRQMKIWVVAESRQWDFFTLKSLNTNSVGRDNFETVSRVTRVFFCCCNFRVFISNRQTMISKQQQFPSFMVSLCHKVLLCV